ncbi:MAG TPA: helix-turn-helix transcriptional regulator [Microthrixaceae bacterium]|nr:helix-turn-helix transcriptional regulator [Microthrixaceae bacterium]
MAEYKTTQVAEILGVSPDTVRRWCDEGRLTCSETGGGHRTIDGADLAEYLMEQAAAYEPDSVMSQSARNRFTGIITRVERDKLVALVEIHSPPHRLVSMMTREAADELNLQPGDLATAAVKSTNVIVELPSP